MTLASRILAQLLKDSGPFACDRVILVEAQGNPYAGDASFFFLSSFLADLSSSLFPLNATTSVELGPSHLDDSGFRVS